MKILFVAMPQSEHAVRHINAISGMGWDIHVFPSYETQVLPYFKNITAYHLTNHRPRNFDPTISVRALFPKRGALRLYNLSREIFSKTERHFPKLTHAIKRSIPQTERYLSWSDRVEWLARVIHELKPEMIHSQTLFNGGQLTYYARELLKTRYPHEPFPIWIASNWGLDLHFFRHIAIHRVYIERILQNADYFVCECERDIAMAREHGFKGEVLPVLPIGGGYDLAHIQDIKPLGLPSSRRTIALKGYQNIVGRALVGIRALELNADLLKGYRVAIYLLSPDYLDIAPYMSERLGIPFDIIPRLPDQDAILKMHGESRLSIGLSISDAISTSLLEAMMMGSFPIQSNTACADEWVEDGQTAFLVPPEDPQEVAIAIKRALTEDALVDQAAVINAKTVAARLDNAVLQPLIIQMYQQIMINRK